MKKFLKNIRYLLAYILGLTFYCIVRIMFRSWLKLFAGLAAGIAMLFPGFMSVCKANIRVAFPDWDDKKVRRTALKSLYTVALNFLEFIWMSGIPRRIEKVCFVPDEVKQTLVDFVKNGVRIIFVHPHLGSWEASGVMAPYFCGANMAAIAKPVRNPYLNRFLNQRNREKNTGLQIIFANGAMQAALKALKSGLGIGTLIDQNTKVRYGGTFVDFFGLPAPSSTAPAVLMRYCRQNNIPAVIVYGSCVRENGRIVSYIELLKKPFDEYADDVEVIQELMHTSEDYIRRYPDQYVWVYKRFSTIPIDADEELQKRYPYYSVLATPRFYDSRLRRPGSAVNND